MYAYSNRATEFSNFLCKLISERIVCDAKKEESKEDKKEDKNEPESDN